MKAAALLLMLALVAATAEARQLLQQRTIAGCRQYVRVDRALSKRKRRVPLARSLTRLAGAARLQGPDRLGTRVCTMCEQGWTLSGTTCTKSTTTTRPAVGPGLPGPGLPGPGLPGPALLPGPQTTIEGCRSYGTDSYGKTVCKECYDRR